LSLAGAAAALWPGRDQAPARLLLGIVASYGAFSIVFRPAVLVEATLMAALLALVLLLAVAGK
jgi:hypothetical protein